MIEDIAGEGGSSSAGKSVARGRRGGKKVAARRATGAKRTVAKKKAPAKRTAVQNGAQITQTGTRYRVRNGRWTTREGAVPPAVARRLTRAYRARQR